MKPEIHTKEDLLENLASLGAKEGDGLFVHASMGAIGLTVGGARTVVDALLQCVGKTGLIGMPGFSSDAYFPAGFDRKALTAAEVDRLEKAVPGFDRLTSPASEMGVIAETFRNWPGTLRSSHPTASVCLNGGDANRYVEEHSLAWATGKNTPLGRLCDRPAMKILLIGVGWNRCSALHTAETLAEHKRTKVRRFKNGRSDGVWMETPDVADDMNRLFPAVGEAFEKTGAVKSGRIGNAECKVCSFRDLVDFAAGWISEANRKSGDLV